MRKFFLTILCLGCALGGESPALDVAAKLLEDYQQQRKACGDEDALQVLRLKIRYIEMKAWTALETDDEAYEQAEKELLALREQAYRLAKARYEQGLATMRDVYETGAELYGMTKYMTNGSKRERPTPEELRTMRSALLRSAEVTGNRADALKTAIIWYSSVEPVLTDIVNRYAEELLKLTREQYQQGLTSYWDFKQAELNVLEVTGEEQYAAYTAELYNEVEENAAATGRNDYRMTELLFLARCRLVEYRKWAELSH